MTKAEKQFVMKSFLFYTHKTIVFTTQSFILYYTGRFCNGSCFLPS